MNNSTEAPASTTVKIKTQNGFEYLLTTRDFDDVELTKKQLAHLLRLDKALVEMKLSPVTGNGFPKKAREVEYVGECPVDHARLIKGTGRVKARCENNKWDFTQKKNVGTCEYLEWNQMTQADL